MAAPAPMTMEPSIDDSDMSGNFKLNGAGSNKVLYYAPFHKNFGKYCGVVPNSYWVSLLPRSRTHRAVVSSSPDSRGVVRSSYSVATRARRRVRAQNQAIPILPPTFDSSGNATIAVSRNHRSPPARARFHRSARAIEARDALDAMIRHLTRSPPPSSPADVPPPPLLPQGYG